MSDERNGVRWRECTCKSTTMTPGEGAVCRKPYWVSLAFRLDGLPVAIQHTVVIEAVAWKKPQ